MLDFWLESTEIPQMKAEEWALARYMHSRLSIIYRIKRAERCSPLIAALEKPTRDAFTA